jgi:hypothetical protein
MTSWADSQSDLFPGRGSCHESEGDVRCPSVWRLPVLGVLLTGLGVMLLSTGVGELVPPVLPASATASSMVAVVTMTDRVAPAALTRTVRSCAWAGAWSGAGEVVLATHGRSRWPVGCLGADLATGRRAESAHLATVALQRPADCGDSRDAIMALAALPHAGRKTGADPQLSDVAADPRQGGVGAALRGPGVPVPEDEPFPHVNDTAAVKTNIQERFGEAARPLA